MNDRVRLGVDFHTFDGIYQGSRSHLLGLYRAAIRQASDIQFVFLLDRPEQLAAVHPEFSAANVQLIRMPRRPGWWRLGWQLAALQRRLALDLLHVQYRMPLLPAGRCLCTLHDVLFETHPQFFSPRFVRMARFSARHAARNAAAILTVSDYSRREIAAHYALDATSVVLTANAVDGQRFHPGSEGEETVLRRGLRPGDYLVSLGRLEPRKNHATLLRAYARLSSPPSLVLIGQRDFAYGEVFRLIESLQLKERVHILEDVDDAELPALLRHARLMAYPSYAEGFGMPVLEALASGVPVITSNATAIPEIAGPAAWRVSPKDIGALTEALAAALGESPGARQSRVQAGLAHAARFTWEAAAAALLAAIRKEQMAFDPT